MNKTLALLVGIFALLASCAPTAGAATYITVSYGSSPYQEYDLRYPNTQTAPAVLFIHGGCWEGGSRSVWDAKANELADAGWITYNMDYRLGTARPWEDIVWDVEQVVYQMMQDNRVESISIVGDSAGAHLGLHYSLKHQGVVNTVAAISPITDPVAWQSSNPSWADCFERFTKSTYQQEPARWNWLSPMWRVKNGRQVTRTYLYGSRADNITNAYQVDAFYAEVTNRGQAIWGTVINRCQSTYPDHGTRLLPCAWPSIRSFLPQP